MLMGFCPAASAIVSLFKSFVEDPDTVVDDRKSLAGPRPEISDVVRISSNIRGGGDLARAAREQQASRERDIRTISKA